MLCGTYCTSNNNFIVCGNSKSEISIYNLSTGKVVSNKGLAVVGQAKTICFETTGCMFFVGDELGGVHSYKFSSMTGRA